MRPEQHSGAGYASGGSIDELLDRAVPATAPGDGGEIRRLTILFADLVDSTVLSTRLEPEPYRLLVGGYRDLVHRTVDRYQGRIASTKGMG